MICGDDFIKRLIEIMQHAARENSFSESALEQVEQQIRHEYGGQAVYIAKLDRVARRSAVIHEFNGRNREDVCKRHNISRFQFYRYIKFGRKVSALK